MKKEIIAVLLLATIFTAALFNIRHMNRLTGELQELIHAAEGYAEAENWRDAAAKAEDAVTRWVANDKYTHLVLRHEEIDRATNAFYELLKEIYEERPGGVKGAAQEVSESLKSISSLEEIRLGNVF